MLNNRDFGAKIADLRKKKGLTQAQLAEMLNISNKTISRWETGEGYPEVTLLSPLAKALGVTVDEMLAEPEPETESVQEQPDRFESFEQVSDTENKKSKVKKNSVKKFIIKSGKKGRLCSHSGSFSRNRKNQCGMKKAFILKEKLLDTLG